MRVLLAAVLTVISLQAAGAVSYNIGTITVFPIKDRDTNMGKEILLDPNSTAAQTALANNQNVSSINAFVIKKGAQITLVDTGVGGSLIANLKQVKITPDRVTDVLITHMHGDHIGGLIKDGKKVFNSATIYLPKKDLSYWLNSTKENKLAATTLQKIYKKQLKTIDFDTQVFPHIAAQNGAGHTPGHTLFEITAPGGEKLLIVGDLIHSLAVQMLDPTQSVSFDTDPVEAAKTRIRILERAAENNETIAGMHIPYPGIGTVEKQENGSFVFVPIQ